MGNKNVIRKREEAVASYAALSRRISALGGIQIGEVGPASELYPLYMIRRGRGPKVLLLAGQHGDEPAGPESDVRFFETESARYEKHFEFISFPCINPWGYEHCRHGNPEGLNTNRRWGPDSPSKEIQLVFAHLEPPSHSKPPYLFGRDGHETMDEWEHVGVEPVGLSPVLFFLYETCHKPELRLGRSIVRNIQGAGYEVCEWPRIPGGDVDGDINDGGVVTYPDGARGSVYTSGDSSDPYLVAHGYTEHAFTIETPLKERMEDRVKMNMIALRTILDAKLRLLAA